MPSALPAARGAVGAAATETLGGGLLGAAATSWLQPPGARKGPVRGPEGPLAARVGGRTGTPRVSGGHQDQERTWPRLSPGRCGAAPGVASPCRQTFLPHGPGLGPGRTPGLTPPVQTPTGTLGRGHPPELHSPCGMFQKNQTRVETSMGRGARVAAWPSACPAPARGRFGRQARWGLCSRLPGPGPSCLCGRPWAVSRMSGLPVPSSAPFPGPHLSVFFPV